jgi:hypothetical protein
MASGKKSAVIYCDLITTVEKMSDEDAGMLLKHFLRYINDLDPEAPNSIVDIVFEPIKQQLKRDLKKWEKKSVRNSEIAKEAWDKRKDANALKRTKNDAKNTVNDNVTVNVTVNDNVNVSDINSEPLKKLEIDFNSFEKTYQELIFDQLWQEQICMTLRVEQDWLREQLENFLNVEIKLKDDWHKGLRQVKQHFINWLKIQIKNATTTTKTGNERTTRQNSLNGLEEAAIRMLEAGNGTDG